MATSVVNPFTTQRIEALSRRVTAATKQQIIDLTEQYTDEIQATITAELGSPAPTELYVDGTLGKPLENVNEFGFTLTDFELLNHVLDEALRLLFQASPVGPPEGGHYRDDHWLYINNVRVNAQPGQSISLGKDDVSVIVNMRPYARKIEGGFRRGGSIKSRRPGLSVQAPDGVYQITAMELRRRFGKVASILYTFRSEGGGNDRNGGYPALVISNL